MGMMGKMGMMGMMGMGGMGGDDVAVDPADDAAAVGDPHMTTNTGKHFDLSLISKSTQAPEEVAFQQQVCGCDCSEGVMDCCMALPAYRDEWGGFCGIPNGNLRTECAGRLGGAQFDSRFCAAGGDEDDSSYAYYYYGALLQGDEDLDLGKMGMGKMGMGMGKMGKMGKMGMMGMMGKMGMGKMG